MASRRRSCAPRRANLANVASGSYGTGATWAATIPMGLLMGSPCCDGWGGWLGQADSPAPTRPVDQVTGRDHLRGKHPQLRDLVRTSRGLTQLGAQPAPGMEGATRWRSGQARWLPAHEHLSCGCPSTEGREDSSARV